MDRVRSDGFANVPRRAMSGKQSPPLSLDVEVAWFGAMQVADEEVEHAPLA